MITVGMTFSYNKFIYICLVMSKKLNPFNLNIKLVTTGHCTYQFLRWHDQGIKAIGHLKRVECIEYE